MTKEQREKISNRLVLNFGILLAGAFILLYVNSALQSNSKATTFMYNALPYVAILSIILGLVIFFWGKIKKNNIKNYSAVCLGTLIASFILYMPKFGWIPNFTSSKAVITVYIAMAVYFVVMAIITAVLLRKPLVKTPVHHTKKKRK